MSSERILVHIRSRNAAASIGQVLDTTLAQEDVDLEVVVVDDASTDGTADAVAAIRDPRVRLVRNAHELGVGPCRAIALGSSEAGFVAEMPPRGTVLPGALRKLVDACAASPRVGLAYALSIETDESGRISRGAFRAKRALFRSMDPRRELLRRGDVLGPLRVFRREALESALHPDADSELVVLARVAGRYELALVPDHLFSDRKAPARSLAESWRDIRACWREHRASGGLFAGRGYSVPSLLVARLADALGLDHFSARVGRTAELAFRSLARALRAPLERLYYGCIGATGRWLPDSVPAGPRSERRIAYYLWHFPVLSQTFLNRELAALRKSGVHVDIVADAPEDLELADHNAQAVLPSTTWLLPIDERRHARYRRFFLRRHPLRYARALLFLMTCRYTAEKRLRTDRKVLAQAVHLAGVLREKGTTHLHAPWADRCALTALVASRLLGISFSFQARAHEIHRRTYRHGLGPLLAPAEFIVTNTRYNESHLRALLDASERARVHVIRNGIDLERFEPPARAGGVRTRLLCVARLIPQKGLVHLLEACRRLLDRGLDLACEIVGGPEEPLYVKYHLELRKAHRRLALGEHVRFRGALPFREVLDCYREADLFALPCVVAPDGARDIIPNSLLEAMAMRLPVVATSIGGIPEMVEHGVSGLIVTPGDSIALADALEGLIRDPGRAAELGAAARRRIEERFDIAKNVAGFVELFSSNGHRRPASPSPVEPIIGDRRGARVQDDLDVAALDPVGAARPPK